MKVASDISSAASAIRANFYIWGVCVCERKGERGSEKERERERKVEC